MNLTASIHQRLLNRAVASHKPFNEILQYYAIERFLVRLAKSPYQTHFVLKGALAVQMWQVALGRPTRDMDFLGYTANSLENMISIVREICSQSVEEDGIRFVPETVVAEIIQEQRDYSGVRIDFQALLGNAKVHMRMDVGFADRVTPHPVEKVYPTILDGLTAPRLLTYPPETMIAEKFHGVVALEEFNSRLKDFYDLWFITETMDFDFSLLQSAVQNTFEQRGTPFPSETPIGLTAEFGQSKQGDWKRYIQKSGMMDAPENFSAIILRLKLFFEPLIEPGIVAHHWAAGSGWK